MKEISGCKDKAELAEIFLLCFVIGIYPLVLFDVDLGNFHMQQFLLFFSAIGVLSYSILHMRSGEWKLKKGCSRIDLAVLALAGYAFFRIIFKMIRTENEGRICFDSELTILAMAILYLLIQGKPVFKALYFDLLLFSGLIVFALLLFRYLCGGEVDGFLTILLQEKEGIASYTILVCMVGLWQYLKCEDRLRALFYTGVLAVGFLVLFINQNRISIWMMAMVFLAMPLMQRPTALLVKKDMQIFFLYLFMLSNMSLLTGYTDLLRVEVHYDLEQSVYLELLVAIGAVFFFKYWDKIPEGIDLRRLVMRKMRRGYRFLFQLTGIVFLGIMAGGTHWQTLPEQAGFHAFQKAAVLLIQEVEQGKSTFYLCFEQFGILGVTLLLILSVLLIGRLWKGYTFNRPVTGVLILISCVFFLQLLFWRVSIHTLPVYWIFMVLAITYKEEKVNVFSKKIKFNEESGENEKNFANACGSSLFGDYGTFYGEGSRNGPRGRNYTIK